jgi:hypothetical protein
MTINDKAFIIIFIICVNVCELNVHLCVEMRKRYCHLITTNTINLLILFTLFHSTDATTKGLKNLSLSIEPAWVRRGQSAQLYCHYEMESSPLYSVKWYRGTLEFYRYSPGENPPAKIFPYTGIKVDVSIPYMIMLTDNIDFSHAKNVP